MDLVEDNLIGMPDIPESGHKGQGCEDKQRYLIPQRETCRTSVGGRLIGSGSPQQLILRSRTQPGISTRGLFSGATLADADRQLRHDGGYEWRTSAALRIAETDEWKLLQAAEVKVVVVVADDGERERDGWIEKQWQFDAQLGLDQWGSAKERQIEKDR
jgi:hypothetical protein